MGGGVRADKPCMSAGCEKPRHVYPGGMVRPHCTEHNREYTRNWNHAHPIRTRWSSYRSRCGHKGITFDLTYEVFERLLRLPCFYCGASGLVGLDRKVPAKGYTESNVVSACFPCNRAKGELTAKSFIAWARRLVDHQS